MELFSEINPLYASSKRTPNVIHIKVRLRDPVDGDIMRHAVDMTMKRYPYFCVELKEKNGQLLFEPNERPVVINDSGKDVALGKDAAAYHLLSFSFHDDWIHANICHALTDGTGSYELIRTLLYYYCTEFYHVSLSTESIRLVGDIIPSEEWVDPAATLEDIPEKSGGKLVPGVFPLKEGVHLSDDGLMVYGISIDESEFMRYTSANDGSPGTMTALLLSRAIDMIHPHSTNAIRISMCVNQRKGLNCPLAHQSLVGGAWLEYKEKMRDWPIDKQATAYRGMVFAQTQEQSILATQAAINRSTRKLLSLDSHKDRLYDARNNSEGLKQLLTATVSYVGKANFGDAEQYIKDFHLLAPPLNESILIEISAVNKRFNLDFIQSFSDAVYVDAFLKQLSENGINYYNQYNETLYLPDLILPWNEQGDGDI